MSLYELASLAAIVLTLVAFVPYIQSIRAGQVKPHFFSWLIWSITTAIVFFAQVEADGGAGAWPTAVGAVITIYVTWLACVLRSDFSSTRIDQVFLVAALLSLPLWYITDDPLWSVVILTAVDTIGFGPTFRKAWVKPHEESLMFYVLFVVRNSLAVLALENFTMTTVLFPATMVVVSIPFCMGLWWRQRNASAPRL